ncbi:MAG: anti-sigma factor [Rhizobacter sp.]|nr:anti-sigma factor [Rhizobacter sp.]
MNTSPTLPPSDERLSAWLDGELPPAEAAQVDAWLAQHPEEAARVRLWAADRDALRARLGPMADEPVPEALAATVWRSVPERSAAWRWVAVLAVFVLGGAVGAGGVWQLQGERSARAAVRAPDGWVQRAAVAHAVYVPEQRHPVEVSVAGGSADDSRAQEAHLAQWLTRRLGVPVKLFDLHEQGFELVGGRLLPDAAGPSAQLMYQARQPGADGQPVRITVYLRKPERGGDFAFRYEREGELGLFYCVEDGVGYAVAGKLPREQLLAVAESIYRQQPAAGQGAQ